jgi:tetratricopeptide (TPR) repeat protein
VALQRNLSRAHLIVGDMLSRLEGNRSEVEMHVRQAIEISTRLSSLDPWNKTAQNDLGQILSSGAEMLSEVGDREEALRQLRVALPIFDALLKEEPNSGAYHLYAGLSKADIGNNMQANAEATAWIRRGLEELEKLVEREPENLTVYLEVLKVRAMLARNLAARKQEQESLSVARDLIARAREVAGKSGPTEVRQELPKAYIVMAKSCGLLGKREEALKWYQSASDAWEGLLAGGLQSIETRQELAGAKKAAGELRLSLAKN